MFVLETKYTLGQRLVKEAGEFLKQHLHDDLQIEVKSHFTDLVTHLDKEVQDTMARQILEAYPQDCIYGEEDEDRTSITEGNVWVIDPIDGTTNFIVQGTDFAVLLAYFENGVGQFGIIYDVMNDLLYHGGGAFPAYVNDQLLEVPTEKDFNQGLFGVNAQLYAQNHGGLAALADQFLGTRSIGSAGISFSYVLTGRLLGQASYVYPWDYVAASIIGEKLGYSMVTLELEQPSFNGREYILFIPTSKIEEVKRYLH